MTAPHLPLATAGAPLTLTINSQQIPQTAEGVTQWIGRNGALLPGLNLDDRLKLLEVLATAARGSVVAECALTEAAAALLLQDIRGNKDSLAKAARAVGGLSWLETHLNTFENPALKSMTLELANLARGSAVR